MNIYEYLYQLGAVLTELSSALSTEMYKGVKELDVHLNGICVKSNEKEKKWHLSPRKIWKVT